MANQTLIPVWDTISGAWSKVSGTKGSFWAALVVILLIALVLGFFTFLVKNIAIINPIVSIVAQIIIFLLEMGLLYIGIQRAFDRPVEYRQMFRALDGGIALKAIGTYILQTLIFILPALVLVAGFVLFSQPERTQTTLIISGILYFIGVIAIVFLAFRLILAMGFVLDQSAGPTAAISKSFHATKSNVWRLIGIHLLFSIILAISAIPLGIGLIWTIPMGFILYGEVYRRLLSNVQNV